MALVKISLLTRLRIDSFLTDFTRVIFDAIYVVKSSQTIHVHVLLYFTTFSPLQWLSLRRHHESPIKLLCNLTFVSFYVEVHSWRGVLQKFLVIHIYQRKEYYRRGNSPMNLSWDELHKFDATIWHASSIFAFSTKGLNSTSSNCSSSSSCQADCRLGKWLLGYRLWLPILPNSIVMESYSMKMEHLK